MCGIAGWFGRSTFEGTPEAAVASMLARIEHRGPDGSGIAILPDSAGALGHRRLAIIDPAGGVQPVWSQDGRSALVFNGEIYNYRELRRGMAAHGVAWRTQSDSEVLLELLCREGPQALGKLRGMYAFAFWDGARNCAVLARDPNGIKPLFIREAGNSLWFASEAKAFPATADWRPGLSPERLHLLLNLRYPAGGGGLMRGVTQLAPGEVIEWSPRGMHRSRIHVQDDRPADSGDVREWVTDSVITHLVSDVPVATYLSGGIDSGIVSYVASRQLGKGLHSFTIRAGDDPREAENARASAQWLGIPNEAADLADAGPEALTWLLWHLETPKINALQSAAVAQLASRRVKVCLSGLGGDELFMGYGAHRSFALATRATRALGPLAGPAGRLAAGALRVFGTFSEPRRAARMLSCAGDAPAAYALLRNVWDGMLPRERVYGERMLDESLPDASEWVRSRWPAAASPLAAMAEFEWREKMVDDLLWHEDRTSMAFGLEVRVPFVDERLHGALARWTEEMARRPGSKHLLKRAFSGQLPSWLLDRPKSGFQLDIANSLDDLFGATLRDWLAPEQVARHRLFNPVFVRELLQLPRSRAHRWHFFMLLLMAQTHRWIDLFEAQRVTVPPQPRLIREVA